MDAALLRQLFAGTAFVSSGVTLPSEVDELSPLNPEETPSNYAAWAEKRRREFRAGRHHTKAALRAAGAGVTTVGRDPDGVPLFPLGYPGSITHTGRMETFAAAVVCPGGGAVGIDAEEVSSLPEDMIAHILTPKERSLLAHSAARAPHFSDEGTLALLAFSAKEAFYKCIFPSTRVRLGFHQVQFVLEAPCTLAIAAPGVFRIRSVDRAVSTVPGSLQGRYYMDHTHIVCGVTWPNSP